MAAEKAIDLEPIAALPAGDAYFQRAASDIALLAGGLMSCVDAPLMAIAVPSDRWGSETPMMLWDQRLEVSAQSGRELVDTAMYAPAVDALCLAADALFARLEAWRWLHADAPGLCVVTDGTGVMLARRKPGESAGAGWLIELAGRDGGAVPVLPLAEDGVWSLIAAEAATLH